MNTKSTILLAALGLGMAASASAQTEIRITGSTAGRSATHENILAILDGEEYATTGSSLSASSSSQAIFRGNLGVGGPEVIIKTSWSGSAAGVRDVMNGNNVSFLPNSVIPANGNPPAFSVTAGTEAGVPDIAMSDVFQDSTPYTSTSLTDIPVFVLPFVWVANDGAPTALSNMTPDLAENLLGNGVVSLATFTGLSSDEGIEVFSTGRDPESGTRITATTEAGLGAFASVTNYEIRTTSGDEITGHRKFPAGTYALGNNGYTSGGTLAGQLARKSLTSMGGYYVSYLGLSDFTNTALPGGAKSLTWCGVPYSIAATRSGAYTFWGYLHFMYGNLTTERQEIADILSAQMSATPGTSGLEIGLMRASRIGDGAVVGQDYNSTPVAEVP